jgi:hypothetical protein
MKRILIVAAAALLAACSSMPGPGARMGGTGGPAHDMAAMGDQDNMCADHMKMMQEMHQKMMGAKTPEERTAMMQEHMKAMQGGMGMMGQVKPGMAMPEPGKPPMAAGMGMHRGMTACRMDMMDMKMTMMMQMMMDRDSAKPPSSK